MKYQGLSTPIRVGSIMIKNRFVIAPVGSLGLADASGSWNQCGTGYYMERARGGTGLIITGVTFFDQVVEEQGLSTVPNPFYRLVSLVKTSREVTERVHAYDSKIFLQLSSGFRHVTIPVNAGDIPSITPFPIPHRWLDETCREISREETQAIIRQFDEAVYYAKWAGFDGVQIHAVHEGYLMDQFAISTFNQRTDEYGGPLENRLRFVGETVEGIKERCDEDSPITLRFSIKSMIRDWHMGALSGEDFEEKDRGVTEGLEATRLLKSYDYDALGTDVGTYDA